MTKLKPVIVEERNVLLGLARLESPGEDGPISTRSTWTENGEIGFPHGKPSTVARRRASGS